MTIAVQWLGRVDYQPTFEAMRAFTAQRTDTSPDVIWMCEHPPVFTQGQAGLAEHILAPGNIPVVQTDRGGQATYHGPGQVVAYPLLDLRRARCYIKEYVRRIEDAVIGTLKQFGVTGHRVIGAPGIYIRLEDPFNPAAIGEITPADNLFRKLGKIAALGIKVHRHCTYHGVALNVDMNLEPFTRINPCGYAGLTATDLSTIGVHAAWQEAAGTLAQKLSDAFVTEKP